METWQNTVLKAAIALVGTGVGGVVTYLWQRRRASDRELFLVLRGAFDRPAFKGPYLWHSDHDAFQQAIAITLKAVKTGRRFDRRGQELDRTEGRYRGTLSIRDPARRKAVQEVEDCLQRVLKPSKEMHGPDATLGATAESIDRDRDQVIRVLNGVWRAFGIEEMRLPTAINSYEDVQDPHA